MKNSHSKATIKAKLQMKMTKRAAPDRRARERAAKEEKDVDETHIRGGGHSIGALSRSHEDILRAINRRTI